MDSSKVTGAAADQRMHTFTSRSGQQLLVWIDHDLFVYLHNRYEYAIRELRLSSQVPTGKKINQMGIYMYN